jgi:hypothetical protein
LTGIMGARSGPRSVCPKATPHAGKARPWVSVTHARGNAIREARMRRVWKGIKERNRIG